jgi:hypothetical protein
MRDAGSPKASDSTFIMPAGIMMPVPITKLPKASAHSIGRSPRGSTGAAAACAAAGGRRRAAGAHAATATGTKS